jgi:DNA polymerase
MLFNQEYNCTTKDFNPDVNCLKCGLYKRCKHPKMEYTGNGKKKCLIIAEAPGEDEDNLGRQLVGKIGQWFRKKLAAFDLSLDDDFYKTNSVCCRPTDPKGNNRKPTPQEIQYCRPRIEALIKKLKPEHIWLMGGVAIESF